VDSQYVESSNRFDIPHVSIKLNGKVVGYGDSSTAKEGVASIGIVLDKSARGLGLGKFAVGALTQVYFNHEIGPVAGTMKANKSMRAVMASLGATEKEETTFLPE
jgi:RimJ/RimL family protein N-acetyltransferase